MYRMFFVLIIPLLAIVLYSCQSQSVSSSDCENELWSQCKVVATRDIVNGDTVINCHIGWVDYDKTLQVPLSMLVDSLRVIRLESSEEAFTGIGTCDFSENYIAVVERMRDAPCKLFTKDGKFISNLGGFGQGPGEFLSNPRSIEIDEDNGRLFIFANNSNKILEYDLSGTLIREIPLAHKGLGGHVKVDYRNSKILVVQIYFENKGHLYSCPVWIQDFEGNAIWQAYDHIESMQGGFSNDPWLYQRNKNGIELYFVRPHAIQDSAYLFDMISHRIRPIFTATFDGNVPEHYYLKIGSRYIVAPTHFGIDNNDWDTRERHIIVDTKTLKGAYTEIYNDFLGGIELDLEQAFHTPNGYFHLIMDPGELLDRIETRLQEPDVTDSEREMLTDLFKDISPDDNSYVIYGHYK